jgi:hypothetical protein
MWLKPTSQHKEITSPFIPWTAAVTRPTKKMATDFQKPSLTIAYLEERAILATPQEAKTTSATSETT